MSARVGRVLGLVITAAALSAAPDHLRGQIVTGTVVQAEGGRPIPHATLELLDDRTDVVSSRTVDSLGAFQIRGWRAGKYRLKTSALGYRSVTSEALELGTGDIVRLTVRLDPDAVPLEPIVVEARARTTLAELALSGYYGRRDAGRRLGQGRFFDRGEIERRGGRLTDILATIPGVRILEVPNCPVPLISMAGNNFTRFETRTDTGQLMRITAATPACNPASVCRANVYVDGVQMHFDETVSIDQTVPLDWVQAIEVYRRASEVPAEYLSRANCGVVAIWTRHG